MLVTWDNLTQMYTAMYQETQEATDDNSKRYAIHAKGMLKLISEIKELPELQNVSLNQSHTALVLQLPGSQTKILLRCKADTSYGIETVNISSGTIEDIGVSSEDVVPKLKSIIEDAKKQS
ncbi:MAG: hypothetical protein K8L99_32100 [Anaerolineae bacterium]|nr:hypothetical protein [Anaerolineae bacterium]